MRHIEAQDPRFFRYRRFVWGIFSVWALLTAGIGVLLDPIYALLGSMIAAVAGGIALILDRYHRTQVENFQHYRQIEALMNLHSLLNLRAPLPPMRLWAASPDFALKVASIILMHQPKTILELGSGTSTLIGSYCLAQLGTGHIISLDHEAVFAQATRDLLAQHNLSQWAQVVHAPLDPLDGQTAHWYAQKALVAIKEVDLLIVDGPPETINPMARYPALPMLIDKLKPGAHILIDDAMRPDEMVMVQRWLADYPLKQIEATANEKGVVVLQLLR
jgi:predicted O-methyltransferase YrrM